eukprot:9384640-Karenia_brevis.AAC.1
MDVIQGSYEASHGGPHGSCKGFIRRSSGDKVAPISGHIAAIWGHRWIAYMVLMLGSCRGRVSVLWMSYCDVQGSAGGIRQGPHGPHEGVMRRSLK